MKSTDSALPGNNYPADVLPAIDEIYGEIESGSVSLGMSQLIAFLRSSRTKLTPDEWSRFVFEFLLRHPIKDLLLQDPFTNHSHMRPRGYPGDASLLDHIYLHQDLGRTRISELGSAINAYTVNAPAPNAVRFRRKYVAELIDEVANEFPNSRMLSLACGHFREAELSQAVRTGAVGDFIAVDHDQQSLDLVDREYGALGVRTIAASAYMLVAGSLKFEGLHLVYASGLYDYLAQPFGQRLTAALFDTLASGGRLMIANFRPGIQDVGYMESFMRWNLIFRTDAEALDLFSRIPTDQIRNISISFDPHCNLVLLEAWRR